MVRAIDAQQSIIQSGMVEKIQQVQQQNPDVQQRNIALNLSEEGRLLKATVKQSEQTEKAEIRDKEERESGRQNREQNSKDPAAVNEEGEFEGEGEHINIKV